MLSSFSIQLFVRIRRPSFAYLISFFARSVSLSVYVNAPKFRWHKHKHTINWTVDILCYSVRNKKREKYFVGKLKNNKKMWKNKVQTEFNHMTHCLNFICASYFIYICITVLFVLFLFCGVKFSSGLKDFHIWIYGFHSIYSLIFVSVFTLSYPFDSK